MRVLLPSSSIPFLEQFPKVLLYSYCLLCHMTLVGI